jgi:cardiolipin synthase
MDLSWAVSATAVTVLFIVIDNFDDRSFETNDEITVGILGADTADKLDKIFERYVKRAEEIDLEKWVKRSIWHKLHDHAAYSINELL